MTASDVPAHVARVIREMHPGGDYDFPIVERFDRSLPASNLEGLAERLADTGGAVVDVVPANAERDRSNFVYVGLDDAPTWVAFNRILRGEARRDVVQDREKLLIYWVIMISRLGPFWMSYWNSFTVRGGQVRADSTPVPRSFEWSQVVNKVSDTLAAAQLEELNSDVLELRLPWLSTRLEPILGARGRDPSPTVYNALFEELP